MKHIDDVVDDIDREIADRNEMISVLEEARAVITEDWKPKVRRGGRKPKRRAALLDTKPR